MNKMHTAKGLVVIETAGVVFPPDAYFDFVECFGLALLSMGTLTVERTRKPDGSSANEIKLPPRTVETAALKLK
jgi:hypothetical protein